VRFDVPQAVRANGGALESLSEVKRPRFTYRHYRMMRVCAFQEGCSLSQCHILTWKLPRSLDQRNLVLVKLSVSNGDARLNVEKMLVHIAGNRHLAQVVYATKPSLLEADVLLGRHDGSLWHYERHFATWLQKLPLRMNIK